METAIADREFVRFQKLIEDEAGIHLGPMKKALLVGRLAKRVHELELDGFAAYLALVERDAAERVQMLERVTTHETHFFREPRHFDFLTREVFPRWAAAAEAGRRERKVRVWSAACSTGEEPYSLAMVLLQAFPRGSGWSVEVLASDLSNRVLQRAATAEWPIDKAAEIPQPLLKAYMLRGTGPREGILKASPELREVVRFSRVNLVAQLPAVGAFDLVFCRNVLIYFDRLTKEGVVRRLMEHLAPDGFLFLGGAESLSGAPLPIRTVFPTVYAHAAPAVRRAS